MNFVSTPLADAFVIEIERIADDRGYFARTFCRREFAEHGLPTDVAQCSIAFNHRLHTLRGLHFQVAPHEEAKVVRCIAGSVYDVIVDMRMESPTSRQWFSIELSAERQNALYVPPGFAHGYLTLSDGATLLYQMSRDQEPAAARGLRWNDPTLAISWPAEPAVIAERDASYPLLEAAR